MPDAVAMHLLQRGNPVIPAITARPYPAADMIGPAASRSVFGKAHRSGTAASALYLLRQKGRLYRRSS